MEPEHEVYEKIQFMKKKLVSLFILFIFEAAAVILWLALDNLFCLFNFSYIGIALSLGIFLFLRKSKPAQKMLCTEAAPGNSCLKTVVLMSIKDRKPDTHINVSPDMEDYHRIIGDEAEPEA